jgi:endoglucanase
LKKLFLIIAVVFSINLISSGVFAQSVQVDVQCRRLGRGVNVLGYDFAFWNNYNNGRFKEKYFQMIKDAGFSSIRVNLQAFRYMDSTNILNAHWLETLDWVVKKSLDAKLLIILDMHEYSIIGENPEGNKQKFISFWKQLSLRYRDQPNDVLFEVLNEPNKKLNAGLWNEYLAEAVKLIRVSNPNRTLIIGPNNWNSIESLDSLALPADDKNIIVTVHFYQPMRFTHQGAWWSKETRDSVGIKWMGTKEEKDFIKDKLKVAANWSKAHNRPIFLGEFGAYDKGDMDSRTRYTACVAHTAEMFNFSWAYWQFDSDFIVYNIDKESWVEPILNALTDKAAK